MTTTVVSFRDVTKSFRTEWEAYIWMVDKFMKDKGNFFVTRIADVKHVLKGGNGVVLFAPASQGMNQPKPLPTDGMRRLASMKDKRSPAYS